MSESVGTVSIDLQLDDRAFSRALLTAEGKAQAAGRAIDDELAGATKRTEARFASFGSVATKALAATGMWDWQTRFNAGGPSVEEKRTAHVLFGKAKTHADKAFAYLSKS